MQHFDHETVDVFGRKQADSQSLARNLISNIQTAAATKTASIWD